MCVNPQIIKHPVTKKEILVPCGRCVECMKDKQNDVAVMCVREAEKRGSFEFVTLTYSNESIPMYFSIRGEDLDELTPPARCPNEETEKEWRKEYFKNHKTCFDSDYYYSVDEDDLMFDYSVTPSLCREDIKDFFKRARRNYSYRHKEDLNFSYICCGEYGPNTGRPHWHLGIFGLTHEQVMEITEDWRKKFGFTTVSTVEPVDLKDGKNHYEAAGKYVGKYLCKPEEIENPAVKEKRVEKPRRQSSIGFGIKDDEEELKRYHYCFDMVGEYDPDNVHELFERLTIDERKQLLNEIIRRKKYYLNGKEYKLPEKIKRRLFTRSYKEVEPDGTIKRKSCPIQIQCLVSSAVRSYFNKNFAEELQQLKSQYGSEVPFEKIREIIHNENTVRQNRGKATFQNMVRNTYKTSYF